MQKITVDISKISWLPESVRERIHQNGGKLSFQTGFTLPEKVVMRRPGPGLKKYFLREITDKSGNMVPVTGYATEAEAVELLKTFHGMKEIIS